jgi:hypothetical protein
MGEAVTTNLIPNQTKKTVIFCQILNSYSHHEPDLGWGYGPITIFPGHLPKIAEHAVKC